VHVFGRAFNNQQTAVGKPNTFETRRNGGNGGEMLYRGFTRMSADQEIINIAGKQIQASRAPSLIVTKLLDS
jgi:hypothetical protein